MSLLILEILTYSKLNLTELYISREIGTNFEEKQFDISPKDFLRFAKEDLKENNDRGYINSLTNSKRAIDCQIDETFEILVNSSDNFNPIVKNFLNYFDFEADIPIKLQIINALNLAPSLIISKFRTLRNKLEHFYQKPSIAEVKEALDVADLFIRSVSGKFNSVWYEFKITDDKNKFEINFEFDPIESNFKIKLLKGKEIVKEFYLDANEVEFWILLRLMLSIDDEIEIQETFKILLKQIGHPIPSDKISIWLYD